MKLKYAPLLFCSATLLALGAEKVQASELIEGADTSAHVESLWEEEKELESDSASLDLSANEDKLSTDSILIHNELNRDTTEEESDPLQQANKSEAENDSTSLKQMSAKQSLNLNSPETELNQYAKLEYLIQMKNQEPLLDPLTYTFTPLKGVFNGKQLESANAVLGPIELPVGVPIKLSLNENPSYEMEDIEFIMGDKEGLIAPLLPSGDALDSLILKEKTSSNSTATLGVLIQEHNGQPVLNRLEYEFRPLEGHFEPQTVKSQMGMISNVELPVETPIEIRLVENESYDMEPVHFIIGVQEGFVVPTTKNGQPFISLHLVERSAVEKEDKEDDTSDYIRLLITKNNKPLPQAEFRLFCWDEFGIPNIILNGRTNEAGSYTLSQFKPNSRYEIRMEEKYLKFDKDAVRFTTDSVGFVNQVRGQDAVDELIFNGYDKDYEGLKTAEVSFQVINSETEQGQGNVVFTANTITPNLQSYQNVVSDAEGHFTFKLEGQEGGKHYSITLSKNAQFLWDFLPEEIVISIDDNQQVTFIDPQEPFLVKSNDRSYLIDDLKQLLYEVEESLENHSFETASMEKWIGIIDSAKAELAKPETTPYYAEGFIQDLKDVKAEMQEYLIGDKKHIEFANDFLRKEVTIALSREENLHDPNRVLKDIDINSYQPTEEDMKNLKRLHITMLYFAADDISDRTLKGLEAASNLEYLSLNYSNASDYTAIKNLTGLNYLSLSGNKLTDIEVINHLNQLNELNISDNELSDLSPLQGKTTIKHLNISGNKIESIEALQTLTNLKVLGAHNNYIKDLAPLSDLTQLENVNLDANQIVDITALQGKDKLRQLNISENKIKNLNPLQGLTRIEVLNIIGNQVEDVTPLSGLTNLKALSVRNNNIVNVEPLQSLTQLRYLHLYENQIENISALGTLVRLEELNISKNKIADISPLSNMSQLIIFFAYQNEIEDVSPLAGLTHLKIANVAENKVYDISALPQRENGQRPSYTIDRGRNQLTIDERDVQMNARRDRIIIPNPIKDINGKPVSIDTSQVQSDGLGEWDYIQAAVDQFNAVRQLLEEEGIIAQTISRREENDTIQIMFDTPLKTQNSLTVAIPFIQREGLLYDTNYVSDMPDTLNKVLSEGMEAVETTNYSLRAAEEPNYVLSNPFSGVIEFTIPLREKEIEQEHEINRRPRMIKVEFVIDEKDADKGKLQLLKEINGELTLVQPSYNLYSSHHVGTWLQQMAPMVIAEEGYEFLGWHPTLEGTLTKDTIFMAQFKELKVAQEESEKPLAPNEKDDNQPQPHIEEPTELGVEGLPKDHPTESQAINSQLDSLSAPQIHPSSDESHAKNEDNQLEVTVKNESGSSQDKLNNDSGENINKPSKVEDTDSSPLNPNKGLDKEIPKKSIEDQFAKQNEKVLVPIGEERPSTPSVWTESDEEDKNIDNLDKPKLIADSDWVDKEIINLESETAVGLPTLDEDKTKDKDVDKEVIGSTDYSNRKQHHLPQTGIAAGHVAPYLAVILNGLGLILVSKKNKKY